MSHFLLGSINLSRTVHGSIHRCDPFDGVVGIDNVEEVELGVDMEVEVDVNVELEVEVEVDKEVDM